MEEIVDKLGWKKVAIILVGLSILGILFALYSFSNSEKQIQNVGIKTGPNQQGESNSSSKGTSNNLPGGGTTPAQNLKTYTTSYFQISYPEKYNGIPYTATKGVLANVKLEDPAVPSRKIEIVVFDSSTSFVSLEQPFKAFKYTKSSVGLNALTGTMYKGTVAGTTLHELIVLVPKNNTTIRVMATYQGKEDANFENEFKSIVRTLN